MTGSSDIAKRLKSRFAELLWAQVRPWAYLDRDGVEVTTFDGRAMAFRSANDPGVREAMWQNYIEPFLQDICRREVAQARAEGLPLSKVREELFRGIARTYWVMADIHRLYWPLPDRTRVDTSSQVDAMMKFLDAEIASPSKAAA